MRDRRVRELDETLRNWINEQLESERIIVKDLRDDLYDGQVLQKLFESLKNSKNLLGLSDIRQAEAGQKRKLQAVLDAVNEELDYNRLGKWGTYIRTATYFFGPLRTGDKFS